MSISCKYRNCINQCEDGLVFCKLHWRVLPNRYKKPGYPYPQVWLEDACRAIRAIEIQFDLNDYPFLSRNIKRKPVLYQVE